MGCTRLILLAVGALLLASCSSESTCDRVCSRAERRYRSRRVDLVALAYRREDCLVSSLPVALDYFPVPAPGAFFGGCDQVDF